MPGVGKPGGLPAGAGAASAELREGLAGAGGPLAGPGRWLGGPADGSPEPAEDRLEIRKDSLALAEDRLEIRKDSLALAEGPPEPADRGQVSGRRGPVLGKREPGGAEGSRRPARAQLGEARMMRRATARAP
jgi:hypothetical protein